jgi:DNA-binding NarL/FixJ family response regulator
MFWTAGGKAGIDRDIETHCRFVGARVRRLANAPLRHGENLMDHVFDIAMAEAQPQTRHSTPQMQKPGITTHRTDSSADAEKDRTIALVESRPFLRECIGRNMQLAFSVPIVTFSSLAELRDHPCGSSAALVILSLIEASQETWANALMDLSEGVSRRPVVTLASTNDVDLARAAMRHGAKGYIPLTMGFDIAIEAIRFVLVGGTYVPTDHLFAADQVQLSPQKTVQPVGVLTGREHSVVRAIKQGKSNKVIAYDLNMCESTVKVHVRNVMKKLNAKNRTDVAMRT